MNKKERVTAILKNLDKVYGTDDRCYLNYETVPQFLVAVILSAQCTDARVNSVTPELFRRFPTPEAFRNAKLQEIEELIHPLGFYHAKAKNIKACMTELIKKHNGEVPDTIKELTALPGVGRKTANVILGNVYRKPAVVVDTHVKRISRKLGLTKETDPVKIERDLMKVLPKDHWILYNMQIITLGRTICKAQNPKCGECFLKEICPSCKK